MGRYFVQLNRYPGGRNGVELLQYLRKELGWAWLIWGGIVLLAVLARLIWLDSLPGVNCDELWYPIQAYRVFHGPQLTWTGLPGSRPLFSPILYPFMLLPGWLGITNFALPRIPTVIASLATLYLVWRWHPWLGKREAAMLVLLLAVCPTQVIYARFSWDPSLTPFCLVVLLSAALRSRWYWIGAAVVLGLSIHPFFVEGIPMAVVLWLARMRPQWTSKLVPLSVLFSILVPFVPSPIAPLDPSWYDYPRYCAGVVDLLSGEATLAYIVDTEHAHLAGPVAYAIGLVWPLLIAVLAWKDAKAGRTIISAFGSGLLTLWALHYNLLGTHAVIPFYDRNGLLLVIPLYTWLVIYGNRLAARLPRPTAWCLVFLISAWLLLDKIGYRYFYSLRVGGSNSHRCFATAAEELRATAFFQACRWLAPGASIVAEDSWIFHPITYLAQPYNILVFHPSSVPDVKQALLQGWVFVVNSYGPLEQQVLDTGLPIRHRTIAQFGGRQVLEVLSLAPTPEKSSTPGPGQ